MLSLFQLASMRLEVPKDVALEDTEAQLDVVSMAQQLWGWEGCGCPSDRGPCVPSCCSACRTWLPSVPSWGCVLLCLLPLPHTHGVTELSLCLPARNRWT